MRSVVTSEGTLSQTPQQIAKRFVTKEVEPFFSDFKLDVARQWFRDFGRALSGLLPSSRRRLFTEFQVAFFNESLDQLIEHLFEQRSFELTFVVGEHFLDLAFMQQTLIHERQIEE